MTTRSLLRRVLRHHVKSRAGRDCADPLSELHPNVQERCLVVMHPYLVESGDGAPRLQAWAESSEEGSNSAAEGRYAARGLRDGIGEVEGRAERQAEVSWWDIGEPKQGPPRREVLVEEMGEMKAELRLRVWARLHDPHERSQLQQDVGRAGVAKRCVRADVEA